MLPVPLFVLFCPLVCLCYLSPCLCVCFRQTCYLSPCLFLFVQRCVCSQMLDSNRNDTLQCKHRMGKENCMRFITVAVRCEASPIIERFALKKETSTGKFDVYSSDENTLVISGAGPTNAAIATSYLLSRQGCNNLDTSVNIGICGTADKSIAIGTPLLCNRVIDHS